SGSIPGSSAVTTSSPSVRVTSIVGRKENSRPSIVRRGNRKRESHSFSRSKRGLQSSSFIGSHLLPGSFPLEVRRRPVADGGSAFSTNDNALFSTNDHAFLIPIIPGRHRAG